ncbi:MAG: nitroreductase family protein [Rhizobiaceae bacterium]|nr:nitroreductase family protein [Rhizobiaceae bacterium]
MTDERKPDHPIDPIFAERWSARSLTGETMPESDILSMFEAARWAHSAANRQPWRFSYALRGDAGFERYVDFLDDGNREWAHKAAAVVIVMARRQTRPADGTAPRPIGTRAFDAGCAVQSFTLQAAMLGYIAHPMAGILPDRIRAGLGVAEEDYDIEAAIAVGRLAPRDELPERFREREKKSPRLPISETAFRGGFKG